VPVSHGIAVLARLADRPEKVKMSVERNGTTMELPLILAYTDQGPNLGISFRTQNHVVKSSSLGSAFADGARETWSTFSLSVESLGLLFRGVNILKAVSGPARITYMVGTTATQSVAQNGAGGIVIAFNFLAFLSIALFIMNLLPIPSLDGGMIVMFVIEAIRKKPLKTKTIYRYQVIGMAFILGLFLLACLSDILFFAGK
jgi:regulator of sigma E protease